jgi:hypothetical protein
MATTDTAWSTKVTISASGKSGTVSKVVGSGALNAEKSYTIRVTVADGSGESYTSFAMRNLNSASREIDILYGGNGVSIGKYAELPGTFDVAYTGKFRKDVMLGEKAGYLDGKPGLYLDAEGFIHLQRSSEQGYYPYVAFYLDAATTPAGQIQLNGAINTLEFLKSAGYVFDNHMYLDNNKAICFKNKTGQAYRNVITWNDGDNVHFAAGSYDSNEGDVYYNGHTVNIRSKTDIGFTVGNAGGALFYPYYKPGDTIASTNVMSLAGYTWTANNQIRLFIPLAKPAVGCSAVSVSGGTWTAVQGGVSTALTPTKIDAALRGGADNFYSGINVYLTFSGATLSVKTAYGMHLTGATISFT